jgi:hypothetical protein
MYVADLRRRIDKMDRIVCLMVFLEDRFIVRGRGRARDTRGKFVAVVVVVVAPWLFVRTHIWSGYCE